MTDMTQQTDLAWSTYETFGERFVRRAVTLDRVRASLDDLDGKGFTIGPFGIDPLGFTKVVATAGIRKPKVHPAGGGNLVAFDVTVPVSVELSLRVGTDTSYRCDVYVKLRLQARTATPLKIVIDIPRISAGDVYIDLRAEGIGAAMVAFVDVIEAELRGQLAQSVTTFLNEPRSRASRVIDIAEKVEDGTGTDQVGPWISYGEFGARFFRHAVSSQRLGAALAELAGRELSIGPLNAGPKDKAEVSATGLVNQPTITATEAELVTFDVVIPIALDLTINLARDFHYKCDIGLNITLIARAADDMLIVIDVPPVTLDDVTVSITARGVLGRVLQTIGGLEDELRKQVVDKANEEIGDPVSGDRVVDVGARVDGA